MTEGEPERPPLPAGWQWRRVGEITASISNGFSCGKHNREGIGTPHLRPMNVSQGFEVDLSDLCFIPESDALDGARVECGDVLFVNTSSQAAVGKCAAYELEESHAFSNHMTRIRLKSDVACARWLVGWMRVLWVDGYFRDVCRNHVNQSSIGKSALGSIEVPIPALREQQRILAALSPLLSGIAAERSRLERAQRNSARARKSLLAAAFRGDLTSEFRRINHQSSASMQEHRTIRQVRRGVPENVTTPPEVESYEVPDNWSKVTVADLLRRGDLVDVKDGNHGANHPKTAELGKVGRPFIMARDVRHFSINYDGSAKIEGAPLSRVRVGFAQKDDVILTHKGTVGEVAVSDRDCVLTPQTTYYRCDQGKLLPRFVMYCLVSPPVQGQMEFQSEQTTRDYLPISEQYKLFLCICGVDEQREIVRQLDEAFAVLDDLDARIVPALRQCDRLRESLLQRAFRGELLPPEDLRGAGQMTSIPSANGGESMAHPTDPRRHRFGGAWTETKLEILRKYLAAYTKALKNQPFSKLYIDAFAGTGYREQRREPSAQLDFPDLADEGAQGLRDGSAVHALRTEPAFDRYVFIERSQKRCAALKQLRAEFPTRAEAIEVREAEANEAIRALCTESWRSRRAVLFLDPYGMQVAWQTIEAIAATKAIDLWLLFPLGIGVNRLLTRSGEIPEDWRRRLDTLLGTQDWFDAFYQVKPAPTLFNDDATQVEKASVDVIGRYFVERLRGIFPAVAEPRVLRNAANNPMYLLCFAAANEKGAKVALRIAEHLLKGR